MIESKNKYIIKEKEKYKKGFSEGLARCDKNWGKMFYPWIEKHDFKTVVDIGCGDGSFLVDSVEKLGFEKGFGLDIASVSLGITKNHSKITYYDSDSSSISLQDKSVDLAGSFEVLEHISYELIDETLSEISRVANEYFICSIASVYSGEEVDGDNLHIIVEDQNWWEAKLSAHFESVKRYKTGYRGAAEYGFVCKINKGEK